MTDFLSRLVERSAGRAAVAHPVVPPLFAAGAPLGAEPVEEELPGGGGSREGPERAAGETSRLLEPAGAARASRDLPVPVSTASEARPGEPRSDPPRPADRVTHPVDGDRRVRARIAREAAPASDRRRSPIAPADGVASPSAELPTDAEPLRALRPREAVSFPRTAPYPDDPSRPAPAPIVRISIGRIDVRAVPPARPAAPAPASVRKDDHLSLEEYLRPRDRRR